jgi:hypothetical protein
MLDEDRKQAELLLTTFCQGIPVFYEGARTDVWEPTPFGPKHKFRYRCVHRPPGLQDTYNHINGVRQIVLNPLIGRSVAWATAESDKYNLLVDFIAPQALRSKLNFSRTKSNGIAATAVFQERIPAETAVRLMERFTRELGPVWNNCEINPKQTELTAETPVGNGVALPFWNCKVLPEIIRLRVPFEEWWIDSSEEVDYNATAGSTAARDDQNEAGNWWDDRSQVGLRENPPKSPLRAMLTFYKENFPGFDFRPCRRGYAVPCPGNPKLGGWPDGAKHSTEDPLLSHEALVFIRNGYPKFKCFHAHCDRPRPDKKTSNNWREFWDPLRLWDFDDWLDAEIVKSERRYAR